MLRDAQLLTVTKIVPPPSRQLYDIDGFRLSVMASRPICNCPCFTSSGECIHVPVLEKWLQRQSVMADFGFNLLCWFEIDLQDTNILHWTFQSPRRDDVEQQVLDLFTSRRLQYKDSTADRLWDDIDSAICRGWRVLLQSPQLHKEQNGND